MRNLRVLERTNVISLFGPDFPLFFISLLSLLLFPRNTWAVMLPLQGEDICTSRLHQDCSVINSVRCMLPFSKMTKSVSCEDLRNSQVGLLRQLLVFTFNPIILAFFPFLINKHEPVLTVILLNRRKNIAQLGMEMKKGVSTKAWQMCSLLITTLSCLPRKSLENYRCC